MVGTGAVAIALVVLLVGGMLALPAGSGDRATTHASPTAATGSIDMVTSAPYLFVPDTLEQIPTGANITVTLTNADNLPHSFTISSREGFVIPTSYTPTQLDQLFVTYPAMYSALVSSSGSQSVGTFESPSAPGWYEFICNVSGHFQNGMYGFIAFGENLPSNLTPPTRVGLGGGNLSAVEIVSAGAVVLLVAIGGAVWYRRRSHRGRPPESLGPSGPN
jgi:plastocyanin